MANDPQQPVVSSHFKLIFLTVAFITVLFIALHAYAMLVAFKTSPLGEAAKAFMDAMSTGWKIGFGAIVGLISGKSIK